MARRRKDQSPSTIKLKQPDRSAPTEKTLLQLAEERGLFDQAKRRQDALEEKAARTTASRPSENEEHNEQELPPAVERVLDTLLWAISLTMLHFTLDVLVQHQYSMDRVVWPKVLSRTGQALLVFAMLVYVLHPHASSPSLLPGLPSRYQSVLRQAIFLITSVCAGCYLIYVTNTFGYLAVMKQAPSLGVLWVWSVIELELPWAVLSLAGTGAFLWQRGYSIK
ncbi:hypothetical protein VTK56DRAFT_7902 [Thermocarpiscus australiensis]